MSIFKICFYLQITGREIPEVVESCIKFIKKFGKYIILIDDFRYIKILTWL